jgi:flagellin
MLSIKQNILSSQSLSASSVMQKKLETSINNLSSGPKKVLKTGVAQPASDKFSSRLRTLTAAELGAQEGISMLQKSDDALGDTQDILQKMRELALKSSDGKLPDEQRGKLQSQIKELKSKIDSISSSAEYNSHKLLDGSGISVSVSTTSYSSVTAAIAINSKFSFNELAAALQAGETIQIPTKEISEKSLGLEELEIDSSDGAKKSISVLDKALNFIFDERTEFKGILSNFKSALNHMQSMSNNLTAADTGSVTGVEAAFEMISVTKSQLMINSGAVLSAHSSNSPKNALSLLK